MRRNFCARSHINLLLFNLDLYFLSLRTSRFQLLAWVFPITLRPKIKSLFCKLIRNPYEHYLSWLLFFFLINNKPNTLQFIKTPELPYKLKCSDYTSRFLSIRNSNYVFRCINLHSNIFRIVSQIRSVPNN